MNKREWLNDRRAYYVYQHWRKGRRRFGEYGPVGEFGQWCFFTANHFWDVTLVWSDNDVRLCCERLGIEVPPLVLPKSYGEDEVICEAVLKEEAY